MDANAIVGLIALCLAGVTGIALLIYFVRAKQEPHFRHMMGAQAPERGGPAVAPRRGTDNADDPFQDLETAASLEEIREKAKKASGRKQEFTLEEKLFQAGIVTEKQRREFQRLRFLSPAIVAPLLSIPLFFAGPLLGIVGLVLGLSLIHI